MASESNTSPPTSISMAELPEKLGQVLGTSSWIEIDQNRINEFAACTEDRQWIHVDPQRAQKDSPFPDTVAHGFLTLSLLSRFVAECLVLRDAEVAINYGLNRVRFPHPVEVGRRLRGQLTLIQCEPIPNGIRYTLSVTIEIEGASKPACVAEAIFMASA